MLNVNEVLINGIDFSSEKNKLYFSRRKQLKSLMKSINSYIDFNSQTYFLALYYMDLIFTHKDLEKIFFSHFALWHQYPVQNVDIQMSNYVLLALACLIIAAKFNENDSNIPTMSSFLRLLYEFSKKKYIFNLEYLYRAEVVVLKILKYKLNYYTIYHYLIFFFTHGIVLKKTIQRSQIYNKKYSERKILEKIYIKVRELFDEIIETEKYYNYYFGKYNYEIVVEILLWCTEQMLKEKISDNENIFKLIFGINIEPNKKKEIYDILEELSIKIKKRNALSKSTRLTEMSNTNNNYNDNKAINQKGNFNMLSSRPQRYDYNNNLNNNNNYNNIQRKPSVTKDEALSYRQNNLQHLAQSLNNFDRNNEYFKYINNTKINEAFNSIDTNYNNFQHKIPYQNNHINNNIYQLNQTTNIKYGPNKRVYLTTSKNNISKSIYNVNSIEKTQIKNNSERMKIMNNTDEKLFLNQRDIKIIPFQTEKEPVDNPKLNSNNKISKIILINEYNDSKMRKKSLSCSKNSKETNFKIFNQRPSLYISSNSISKKINFEEVINNPKIIPPESSKELNNYFFNLKSKEELNEKNKLEDRPFIKKEILIKGNNNQKSQYKKYLLTKKSFQKSSNIENKIMKDNLINRKKYFDINNQDIKKFNITLDLEPQDNYKRKSVNKYYSNAGNTTNNINQNLNKAKTIIINNNIQINTLINDKSKNLYLVEKDGFKYNYENKNKNGVKIVTMKNESKNIRNNINKINNFIY